MHIKTTLLACLISSVSAQNSAALAQYSSDIRAYVSQLVVPDVIEAFAAIQSVDEAAFLSLANSPAVALAMGATMTAEPSFYSLLPSSALAVVESIDSRAAAIYTSDVLDYSASAAASATMSTAMSTSMSTPTAGSTSANSGTMSTPTPSATPMSTGSTGSLASAASPASSSTAGVGRAAVLNVVGAAAGAAGVAVAAIL